MNPRQHDGRPARLTPYFIAITIWRDHAGSILRGLVTLASAVILLRSYVLTYRDFAPVAFWDMWNWVADLQRYYAGNYHLGDLLGQHNEHRIATTRIFLFIDVKLFHMTGRFVVIANLVLLAMTGVLMKYIVHSAAVAKTRADMPALFYIACLTSFCQWENLLSPFQIQFVLTCLFVLLAATLLALATRPGLPSGQAARQAGLAACSYALAVFSMASGVLALAPLLLLLLLRRVRMRIALLFLAPAFTGAALFFYHYQMQAYPPLGLRGHAEIILQLVLFVASFVGGALSVYGAWAYIIGLPALMVLVAIGASLFYHRYRTGTAVGTRTAILFAVACYVALCACSAMLARFGAGGVHAAVAPRYSLLSILYGLCIGGLMVHYLARNPHRIARVLLASWAPAGAALVGLALINLSPVSASLAADWHARLVKDANRVRQNVDYDVPQQAMYWDRIDDISAKLEFLRRTRLNLFAPIYDPPASVQAHLAASGQAGLAACTGKIEQSFRLDLSRMVLAGWIANPGLTRTADWIGLADGTNRVIAAFRPDIKRKSIRKRHHLKREAYGFDSAFGGLPPPGEREANLHLVGLFDGSPGETCMLNVPQMASSVIVQPLPARVTPTTARRTETTASFAPGAAADAKLAPPWPNTSYISTSTAGDAATGRAAYQASWTGANDGALLVPFASGPDPAGQSLHFTFADGTNFSMPLPAYDPNQRWRVAALPSALLRQHGGAVAIIAEDSGMGWGQWMAIADPVTGRIAPDSARLYH